MQAVATTRSKFDAQRKSYNEVCRLYEYALHTRRSDTVFIDLSHLDDATTSAFAQLVLLRRMLLQQGRDLRLRGLQGRAARLYEIERLQTVLPRA